MLSPLVAGGTTALAARAEESEQRASVRRQGAGCETTGTGPGARDRATNANANNTIIHSLSSVGQGISPDPYLKELKLENALGRIACS